LSDTTIDAEGPNVAVGQPALPRPADRADRARVLIADPAAADLRGAAPFGPGLHEAGNLRLVNAESRHLRSVPCRPRAELSYAG
jgi:hypothetical protein